MPYPFVLEIFNKLQRKQKVTNLTHPPHNLFSCLYLFLKYIIRYDIKHRYIKLIPKQCEILESTFAHLQPTSAFSIWANSLTKLFTSELTYYP